MSLGRIKILPACSSRQFSGDPPLPVVWFMPANRPQGNFLAMKKKILLVDDDPGVRRMLQRVLEEENYLVVPAADGLEGLQLANATALDLVVLDLNLPAQNGWDTFERLTDENPLLAVIIIMARPNQLFPALASSAGALMEKPLDLPKLLRTICDLLAEPAETRQARAAGGRAEFHDSLVNRI